MAPTTVHMYLYVVVLYKCQRLITGHFNTSPNRWRDVRFFNQILISSKMQKSFMGTNVISTLGDVKVANDDY